MYYNTQIRFVFQISHLYSNILYSSAQILSTKIKLLFSNARPRLSEGTF